ncbi:hypothetical protein [Mycobacteroides abscessus]|uniref:hypothetical protein n=1 Tax=Mycobacteroides abscessus TaxID=36809 RepID=UPI0005DD542C|nr:hypothetical protein [Mycobacteroides abscessus]CPW73095.1 Uncharacterised protein [Mycobacteroides abscessus]SKF61036.1 Uncharacterised protein [Mycobacteroides abscessus subsp. bolletii]SKH65418.1 Uncharacterised protein [Mycobacteroides abscessus subsp. bolletii]
MASNREESDREFIAAVMGPFKEVEVPPVRPAAPGAESESGPSGLSAPGIHAMWWQLDRLQQNLADGVIDGEVLAVADESPAALPSSLDRPDSV